MLPTVLIPGLLGTSELYAAQIPALWPYGPVTVANTLRGNTIAEIAANIPADAPPRFALAGISMGGYISFEIIRQAPERVARLALLDTTARPDTPEQTANRRAAIEQARSGDFRAIIEQAFRNMVAPANANNQSLLETCMRMGLSVGVEGFTRQNEAILARIDSRPSLPAIRIPTLVLVGENDPLTPPDRAEEMAGLIPDANFTVIPNSGHASTLEQPEAVNAALIQWLTT